MSQAGYGWLNAVGAALLLPMAALALFTARRHPVAAKGLGG